MEQATPRYYLVNHGRYYAKEILFGCVFVPKTDAEEAERMREIRVGDVIFHGSGSGISAVGVAVRRSRVVPYPAWRYAEGAPGARGEWLDTRDRLLAVPFPFRFSLGEYLTFVSNEKAEEWLSALARSNGFSTAFDVLAF